MYRHWLSEIVISAFQEVLGLPWTDDFNGVHVMEEGVGFNQVNIKDGQRCSLSDAMLTKEVLRRENLFIWTESQVEKVVFQDKRARGVLLRGKTILVKAGGEVILSAGAYNSPQVLQLSGIGDATLLESLGIPVLVNNTQVGQNLMDHPLVPLSHSRNITDGGLDQYRGAFSKAAATLEWLFKRGDSEMSTNVGEVNGFYISDAYKRLNHSVPDLQLLGGASTFLDHGR